jgi:hypothetical protein
VAGDRKAAREKAEEQHRREEEARRAAASAAAYAKRLDELATRAEAAWQEVAALIATNTKPFLELRAQHRGKPSLLARFDKAALPR